MNKKITAGLLSLVLTGVLSFSSGRWSGLKEGNEKGFIKGVESVGAKTKPTIIDELL